MQLTKIINSTSVYLFSRYFIYGIQFLNSLLIALYLGPFYLGVWGFFNLITQYTEQINLGIANASNVFLSIGKSNKKYNSFLIGNSFVLITLFTFFVVLVLLCSFFIFDIGKEYNMRVFFFPIIIITITTYLNSILLNIMRVYDRLNLIVFSQALYPILTFVVLLFVRTELLLKSLVYVYLFSNSLLTFFFYYYKPIEIKLNFNIDISYKILNKAIPLFFYNCFFYLIMISTRTAISLNYSISEFGIFTFTFSLSNIVLLLFESITFLIWPKLINRFNNSDKLISFEILKKVRSVYLVSSHFLMYLALIFYPIFVMFFEKYQSSFRIFGFNLLTVLILNSSFGFQPFIIAQSKQKKLSYLSLICFFVNIIASIFIIYVFNLSFEYVILATLISYFVFSIIAGYYCYYLIGIQNKLRIWGLIFPIRIFLPFSLAFSALFFNITGTYVILMIFALFLLLNYRNFLIVKNIVFSVLKQPNFFKI